MIVFGLREVGASVQSLSAIGHGCPDLLVGYRGNNYLLEIKANSKKKFTPDQVNWHLAWRGVAYRANNLRQALAIIGCEITGGTVV